MQRLSRGSQLVVASHNAGKVWEINQLIAPYGLAAISAGELGLPEPEETEATFHGNAHLKARAAAEGANLPALADDSGLEVEVLGGAPGIYSARWAGPSRDFGLAMHKVGEEITRRQGWSAPGPRANFISVLCLAWPGANHSFYDGRVDGTLVWPPRGGNGFGYDPIFMPDGHDRTFGEMEPAAKYAISHRTRAFAKFKTECLDAIADGDKGPNAERDKAGLAAAAANISTREELITFIRYLQRDAAQSPLQTLQAYFDQLEKSVVARDVPKSEPVWRTIAKALLSGRT